MKMGFFDFFKKSNNVKLSDAEWEHLYKTDFEEFWEMVVKEGDLTKLPNRIVEPRGDETLYGNEAREYFLSCLKQTISPSKFDCDLKWRSLLKYKQILKENNHSTCMLDAIREYERHIKY